jgi:hypothetical protein
MEGMDMSKHLAKLLGPLVLAVTAVAMLAPVAQAEEPAENYGQFAGCPSPKSENSAISTCIRSEVIGGHFKMGNKEVPISKTIEISGGVDTEAENFDYSPAGGIKPVPLIVPGGVIGLTGLNWLIEFLNVEQLKLYAVTELAGTPDVSQPEEPVLPIKVHLINTVLGKKCYIGSQSNPITLNLTAYTTEPPPPNEPITGKEAQFSFNPTLEILKGVEGEYVDNAFAAPGANGCVLTLFGFLPVPLNGVVNIASGLPSPAGTNETRQNFNIEVVESALVYP